VYFSSGKYKVERIVLFGSIVKKEWRPNSDIDLGVKGIGKKVFIKALAETENFVGVPVEIKPLEDCSPFLKAQIEKEGIVLYEKQRSNPHPNFGSRRGFEKLRKS
jgi:predicted nucleotidyltransferase